MSGSARWKGAARGTARTALCLPWASNPEAGQTSCILRVRPLLPRPTSPLDGVRWLVCARARLPTDPAGRASGLAPSSARQASAPVAAALPPGFARRRRRPPSAAVPAAVPAARPCGISAQPALAGLHSGLAAAAVWLLCRALAAPHRPLGRLPVRPLIPVTSKPIWSCPQAPAVLTFRNELDRAVKIYWVRGSGQRFTHVRARGACAARRTGQVPDRPAWRRPACTLAVDHLTSTRGFTTQSHFPAVVAGPAWEHPLASPRCN